MTGRDFMRDSLKAPLVAFNFDAILSESQNQCVLSSKGLKG